LNLSPFSETAAGSPAKKGTDSKSNLTPFVVPFAVFIALLAASPLLEGFVDARWLVVGRGLVAAALLAWFWRFYSELRAPAGAGPGLAAIGLGVLVGFLWIGLDFGWTRIGDPGRGFVPLRADGSLDPLLVALRLFGFVLVVPVMEELFWRSFLMRRIDRADFLSLDPRATSAMALVLTSAAFALEHREWLAGLVAGLAYGTVYRRTGNLSAAIASHASTNLTMAGWVLATGEWRHW
jgi:CAAX prenyl protease-like protein